MRYLKPPPDFLIWISSWSQLLCLMVTPQKSFCFILFFPIPTELESLPKHLFFEKLFAMWAALVHPYIHFVFHSSHTQKSSFENGDSVILEHDVTACLNGELYFTKWAGEQIRMSPMLRLLVLPSPHLPHHCNTSIGLLHPSLFTKRAHLTPLYYKNGCFKARTIINEA